MRALLIALLLLPSALAVQVIDGTTGEPFSAGYLRYETPGARRDLVIAQDGVALEIGEKGLVLVRTAPEGTFGHYAVVYPEQAGLPIVVRPAGLAMGTVSDARENLVAHADVLVSCPSESIESTTDAAGRFRLFLPAERCVIAVHHLDATGSAEVAVAQGGTVEAGIRLERTVRSATAWYRYAGIALLVALLVALVLVVRHKRGYVAERVKPALKTKEGLIIDELLLRGGRAKLAELRTAVQLPRTSLLRTIESLEQRGLAIKKAENSKVMVELVKK